MNAENEVVLQSIKANVKWRINHHHHIVTQPIEKKYLYFFYYNVMANYNGKYYMYNNNGNDKFLKSYKKAIRMIIIPENRGP